MKNTTFKGGPEPQPGKNNPVKPDIDPDPTKTPEKNDPTKIEEPKKNDPTRIDEPPPLKTE